MSLFPGSDYMFAQVSEAHDTALSRIMIVEDEGIIAGHIATRLQKTGYVVAGISGSSEEALAQIPDLRPDLILMDIRIKGDLDGIETAAAVRERFDIPVIYLTAHTDRHTINRAKRTGAFGFLTKPIHHTSLATSIEMALHKHSSEREVRQQRAWIETVVNTMGDAVAVVDREWKIRFVNRPAENLIGWKNAEARDCDLSTVLPLFDPASGFRTNNSPERFPEGTYAVARSGQMFPVEGEIASSLDQGKAVGRVLTFRDATQRQDEDRRKRQEEKMQAVGRLAAGISHDFNNLLFVILGYADQLLGTAGAGTPAASGLGQIKKAAETAVGITRQLVQYGRPEAAQPQDIDLNDLIRETEELWRRLAGGSIMWETRLDPTISNVRADPGQMKQVLMNLIANARDAMPRGGVLTVETKNVASSVTITVRDTGAGMSTETVDRIFEPYFTTKGGGKGTGLGLSIVHRIVMDLGGTIRVASDIGKGSTFTIRLPRNNGH